MATNTRKRTDLSVDFTGVESGGSRAIPDGEYLLEVVSVEEKETKDGDSSYLAWKWKIVDGEYKSATVYDNTSLKPTALWRLKTLLEVLGMEVSGKMGLNFGELKGKRLLAKIANETYQGKEKPRLTEFLRGLSASGSAPAQSSLKGKSVSFEFEGETFTGVVLSASGGKLIVETEVEGVKEEWELEEGDVKVSE